MRPAVTEVLQGWAEANVKIAEIGDDPLAMGEFGNEAGHAAMKELYRRSEKRSSRRATKKSTCSGRRSSVWKLERGAELIRETYRGLRPRRAGEGVA